MIHWGGLTSAPLRLLMVMVFCPKTTMEFNEKLTPNLLVWRWFKVVKSMSPTKQKKKKWTLDEFIYKLATRLGSNWYYFIGRGRTYLMGLPPYIYALSSQSRQAGSLKWCGMWRRIVRANILLIFHVTS